MITNRGNTYVVYTLEDKSITSFIPLVSVQLESLFKKNPLFFSSPEHEVLMVSYCGQWLSVVV